MCAVANLPDIPPPDLLIVILILTLIALQRRTLYTVITASLLDISTSQLAHMYLHRPQQNS